MEHLARTESDERAHRSLERRLRARAADRRTIGEALLDQRISAGIGNVYRCDVLFLHGLHPATPVDDVDDALARSLFATAARLLRANLTTADRTTTDGRPGTLWVHGRGGHPCRRCGTAVVVEHLGEQGQPVGARAAGVLAVQPCQTLLDQPGSRRPSLDPTLKDLTPVAVVGEVVATTCLLGRQGQLEGSVRIPQQVGDDPPVPHGECLPEGMVHLVRQRVVGSFGSCKHGHGGTSSRPCRAP